MIEIGIANWFVMRASPVSFVRELKTQIMPITHMPRRAFLAGTLAASVAPQLLTAATPDAVGAIDTHTHFYDPTRPHGVKWPAKNETALYRTILPGEFKKLAAPLGIVGTVVVEASPVVEDNQWVLDLATKEPFIVGLMGHLKPGRPGFAEDLKRFAANPKFRGARVGGWDTSLEGPDTAFGRDLRLFVERDLAIDVMANAGTLPVVAAIAKALPGLRIIINHSAGVKFDGQAPPAEWCDGIRSCAGNPNVFMKFSGLVEMTGRKKGEVPADIAYYRPALDVIWEAFGEDRVVFGSNWPVSAPFAPLAVVHQLAVDYGRSKGIAALAKLMHVNARKVYKLAGNVASAPRK